MVIRLRTLAIAAVVAAVLALAAGVLLVQLGVYDISATRQHTAPVYKLLDHAMRRSIKARAGGAAVPPLDSRERVLAGAAHYQRHCLQCHGAPGVSPHPLAFGLTPAPANLLAAGRHWAPAEIFWVVKHGIKMTGMPAWAIRLSDDEIWDVVAFVRAMPALAPREYALMAAALPQSEETPGAATRHAPQPPLRPGDVQAGRAATALYLCATCHVIPGFVSANHHVGPPLGGMGRRAFIGGVLPYSRENMVRWLMDPQQVDPLSAMPAMGLTEQDAHDIAAFLDTLDKVETK